MAVSEETIPRRRLIRVARPGRTFVAFVASLGLGIAAAVGGLAAYHQTLVDRILPGVSVAGVDVGGMTRSDAHAVLAERFRSLSEGGLLVRSGLGSTTIKFADVGRAADVDTMVAEAIAVGRGGTAVDETIAGLRLRLHPETIGLRLLYDHDRAAAAIAMFAGRVGLGSIDASILRTPSGFAVIPSVDGTAVDTGVAIASVDRAMADPTTSTGARIDVPVVSSVPVRSTDRANEAIAVAGRMTGSLKLVNGKKTWTISNSRIQLWTGFEPTAEGFRPVLNRNSIAKYLKPIAKNVLTPVRDASFLRDKRGRIVGARADHAGRILDPATTVDRIATALESRVAGEQPANVPLAMVAVLPKRTTADVTQTAPLMVKVGSWTTFYQVAAHNGFGANITVPARTLNGTVVQPGQLFDFWGALGEVSFRTGYRLGGAIVGGHSVEGKALAGGICAASTTLFNAALRGGFEIVSRQPHWYYITRYPLGLDATVSGSQSMQFRNDTANPILIQGFASPGIVRFEIWSVPTGRTVTLSRPIVTNVVPGYDTTVKTSSLPAGSSLRTEWPVDGKDVVVTRTVRDANGRVIHQETYVSHYHRMVGINMIGIG
jgi:vancomycin resistance protein YoaR